jgi:predicted Zn-dependent protease with MMP-like domain
MRLTYEQFGELVEEALKGLPEEFARRMENVIVEVEPRPSRQLLAQMKLPRGHMLLGYYHGVPLTEKSVSAPYEMPEQILLFKDNIESICRTQQEVVEQVRKTLLHEIGHHFGMDEDDLDEVGFG